MDRAALPHEAYEILATIQKHLVQLRATEVDPTLITELQHIIDQIAGSIEVEQIAVAAARSAARK